MGKSTHIVKSFVNAISVFLYTLLVVWILFNAKEIFGEQEDLFIPLFMLLLFIVSATITGLLVLGKPIHLYLSGFKKDALILLFATLIWLIVFLIGVITVLVLQ